MFNPIEAKKRLVQERIEKSFNNDIEKARKAGDVHPNGKWVWTEYQPGKFDWRGVKKNQKSGSTTAQPSQSAAKPAPRDKIAQNNGFKDYDEMRGYQEYVTAKNLLKKPSTKGDARKEMETQVANYEKDHADVIAARGKKKDDKKVEKKVEKKPEKVFSGKKLTEILDSLDDWEDYDWNNQDLNEKLSNAITNAIKKEGIDENKFNQIAKKYKGLDLVYSDYVSESDNDFDKVLSQVDEWEEDDWFDEKKNDKLMSDIKGLIIKHKMSESDFGKIAKKYQGLDLVYTDYIPKNSDLYKKYNSKK